MKKENEYIIKEHNKIDLIELKQWIDKQINNGYTILQYNDIWEYIDSIYYDNSIIGFTLIANKG